LFYSGDFSRIKSPVGEVRGEFVRQTPGGIPVSDLDADIESQTSRRYRLGAPQPNSARPGFSPTPINPLVNFFEMKRLDQIIPMSSVNREVMLATTLSGGSVAEVKGDLLYVPEFKDQGDAVVLSPHCENLSNTVSLWSMIYADTSSSTLYRRMMNLRAGSRPYYSYAIQELTLRSNRGGD